MRRARVRKAGLRSFERAAFESVIASLPGSRLAYLLAIELGVTGKEAVKLLVGDLTDDGRSGKTHLRRRRQDRRRRERHPAPSAIPAPLQGAIADHLKWRRSQCDHHQRPLMLLGKKRCPRCKEPLAFLTAALFVSRRGLPLSHRGLQRQFVALRGRAHLDPRIGFDDLTRTSRSTTDAVPVDEGTALT